MFISVDVGGSNGRVAAFRTLSDTTPLARLDFEMSTKHRAADADYQQDMLMLQERIWELAVVHDHVEGIGIAVAGKLDKQRRKLVMAGNISHWVNQPFASMLETEFDCRVVAGNDAEALALAEAVYGLGTQAPYQGVDFVGMIWGSGVGGACVRHPDGGGFMTIPGEPGHIPVGPDTGLLCGCGFGGCVESYTGGNRIRERLGKRSEQMTYSEWDQVIDLHLIGLKAYLRVQPVGLVVYSGGVACGNRWVLDDFERRLAQPEFGFPAVRLSAFGESAGSLGALSMLSR